MNLRSPYYMKIQWSTRCSDFIWWQWKRWFVFLTIIVKHFQISAFYIGHEIIISFKAPVKNLNHAFLYSLIKQGWYLKTTHFWSTDFMPERLNFVCMSNCQLFDSAFIIYMVQSKWNWISLAPKTISYHSDPMLSDDLLKTLAHLSITGTYFRKEECFIHMVAG